MHTESTGIVRDYLKKIKGKFYAGDATEHNYRSALESLVEGLLPGISALNERKRVSVGAPDFCLFRKRQSPDQMELIKRMPVGFIEAKDIEHCQKIIKILVETDRIMNQIG